MFLVSCGKNSTEEKNKMLGKSGTPKSQSSISEEKEKLLKESEQLNSSCQYACYLSGNRRTSASIAKTLECLSSCNQASVSKKIEIEKMK